MPETKVPSQGVSLRDPRLDVFRGLCLVMIFINHVPGNAYELFTSRNFGFSDAAEAFVMMSGIAAGLAYSRDFATPGRLWTGLSRVWGRAWTLYLVHLMVTAWALACAAAVALWLKNGQLLHENEVNVLFEQPLGVMLGVPLLTHQFGYTNILPLYAVLLLASPLVFWAGRRWPLVVLGLSFLLWAVAANWRLNLPRYPQSGGWFFDPFCWQVLFVVGLLTGMATKEGRRLVPIKPWLQWLTGLFLLFVLLWQRVPMVRESVFPLLGEAYKMGVPWFLVAFDKTYETLPRLLHILALVYFISSFPVLRQVCGKAIFRPLEIMGRQALPVFAFGTLLAIFLQGVKHVTGRDLLVDSLLLGGGLGLQFALAWVRMNWPKAPAYSVAGASGSGASGSGQSKS
jgi:hypothetical protein